MSYAAEIATGPALDNLLALSASTRQSVVARFKSDNDRNQFALEVIKIIKRGNTSPHTLLTHDVTEPTIYAKRLFRRHVEALDQQHLQTSRMILKNFEWLYPGADTTADELAIFDNISTQAMIVSNDDLSKIMRMTPSTLSDPPAKLGAYFYVRSWSLSGDQLRMLLDYLARNELRFEETDNWKVLLDVYHHNHTNAPLIYTLRYVGTVNGPRRPIDRFIEDLHQRKSGIMVEVIKALEECLPEVAEAAEVHGLPDAYLPPGSHLFKDDVERVLIEFFHHPTLLNRQRGGFYSSYVPSTDDADGFRDMKTNFWYTFRQGASLPDDHLQAQIAGHFREIQQYANANPEETGTGQHEFTDELRMVNERQARPLLYQGQTVVVFVGKDQTYDEYLAPKPFVHGKSRAGNLTKDFFYRLVHWEAMAHKRAFYPEAFDPTSGPYCFVDLWPWLWHKNIVCAAEFLQWYLNFVRPIIAATYSRLVNNVTLANFRHGNGVRMNNFTSAVGKASIQYYDHNDETGEPDENSAFINIPHIHPGRDKYGSQHPALRRVLDLTIQYTFLFGDVTMQVLDEYDFANLLDDDKPSRKQLCEEILVRVESLFTDSPPHKRFYESFQSAREELLQYFRTSTTSHMEERPVLNADGRLKLISLGQAEGEQDSTARETQLQQLWADDLPDLHTIIPHREQHRNEWMKDMAKVPKGLYIDQKRGTDVVVELIGERGPEKFLSPRDCQGRSLKVFANGKFSVRWINGADDRVTTRLLCKPAIPTTSTGRFLFFTAAGMDVLGASQQNFRPILFGNKLADASLTVRSFATDLAVKELWTIACTEHGVSTEALEELGDGDDIVDWGSKKGVAALVTNASSEKPRQNRPPQRLDAIWLLNEFILQHDHLADGGIFRTATTDKFPDSTEDLLAFVQFLKQPEYIKHPYTSWWLKFLDVDVPQVTVLAKNLPMLRNSVCINQQEKSKSLRIATKNISTDSSKGVQVHERYYILGQPGSAVLDPFAEGSDQSCISDEARKKAKKALKTAGAAAAGEDAAAAEGDAAGEESALGREDEAAAVEPAPKAKKKVGRLSKAASAADVGAGDAAGAEPAPKAKKKAGRPSKAAIAAAADADDDDDGEESAPKTKKKGGKASESGIRTPFRNLGLLKGRKGKGKAVEDEDEDEDDNDDDVAVQQQISAAPTVKTKRKRGGDGEDDEDDEMVLSPVLATQGRGKKGNKKIKRRKAVVADDDEE
ncbi:hypothetical protein LTR36_006954 [Oleoguttula mirabilis]|uniref:Uncharacterized protein n=1 Tax=Oleoguttula mirabilis TaxID=1507867 RepID=A0AAV9JB15_9PEZI|nr:hypothetical protein LTR36_006954 [Oleoguttula mirabilis]